jgi:hypothetical protein
VKGRNKRIKKTAVGKDELSQLYFSRNIIMMNHIKEDGSSGAFRTCGRNGKCVGNSQKRHGKKPARRHRHRQEDDIKTDVKETRCGLDSLLRLRCSGGILMR